MLCCLHALIVVIQNTLLFGEDFYARKSVRYGAVSPITREKAAPVEASMGIPSRSKADSTELIHGFDLSDKFTYLPDDSIDKIQQVKMSEVWVLDDLLLGGGAVYVFRIYCMVQYVF